MSEERFISLATFLIQSIAYAKERIASFHWIYFTYTWFSMHWTFYIRVNTTLRHRCFYLL